MKKYQIYYNNTVEINNVAEFDTLDEAKQYCTENTKGYDKNIYDLTDSEIKQYRDQILSQDDIENIELRIHFGNLEWRDWERHKKWHGIETNM